MWLTVVYMEANVGKFGAVGTPLAGGSGCRLVSSGSFMGRRRAFNGTAEGHIVLPPGRKPRTHYACRSGVFGHPLFRTLSEEAMQHTNFIIAGNRDKKHFWRETTSHPQLRELRDIWRTTIKCVPRVFSESDQRPARQWPIHDNSPCGGQAEGIHQ